MKKLTAKQRGKIYREIADEFEIFGWTFVCGCLQEKFNRQVKVEFIKKASDSLEYFPEFALFKPEVPEFAGCLWWSGDDNYDRNTRIIALLFSEQIALNP